MIAAVVPPVLVVPGDVGPAGVDAAFYPVFAVFVVAFVVLAVVSIRWALRRDRVGRAEWVERQQRRGAADVLQPPADQADQVPSPRTNGHGPRRPDKRGREREQPG